MYTLNWHLFFKVYGYNYKNAERWKMINKVFPIRNLRLCLQYLVNTLFLFSFLFSSSRYIYREWKRCVPHATCSKSAKCMPWLTHLIKGLRQNACLKRIITAQKNKKTANLQNALNRSWIWAQFSLNVLKSPTGYGVNLILLYLMLLAYKCILSQMHVTLSTCWRW